MVSRHHLLGLPVQAKPIWDAISQANVEPMSLSRNLIGRQGEESVRCLVYCQLTIQGEIGVITN